MSDPTLLAPVQEATQRLVRTVDGLPEPAWHGPSLLPGWSRAHVVAHLALNAEALGAVLEGLATGTEVPMYRSAAARDEDIEDLVRAGTQQVRDRLLGSTTRFGEALAAMPESAWRGTVERVPGGPVLPAVGVPAMRWREVEIHHVDLDAGYTHRDWDPGFADAAVDFLAGRQAEQRPGDGFTVALVDQDRTVEVGSVGPAAPLVRGSAVDLAWWLSGRGAGEGLACEGGALPQMGSW